MCMLSSRNIIKTHSEWHGPSHCLRWLLPQPAFGVILWRRHLAFPSKIILNSFVHITRKFDTLTHRKENMDDAHSSYGQPTVTQRVTSASEVLKSKKVHASRGLSPSPLGNTNFPPFCMLLFSVLTVIVFQRKGELVSV
jgi:hypothetical protein